MELDAPCLIEALPAMGKSYGVVQWAAETGNPLTVLTSRHDLYDQYGAWAEEHDLSCTKIPASYTDCGVLRSDTHGKWTKNIEAEKRGKGLSVASIHRRANQLFGKHLPCQENGKCEYMAKRESLETTEFDVLVGHYTQAYNESWIAGRYLAIDEFPGRSYLKEFEQTRFSEAVNSYLDGRLPYRSIVHLENKRRSAVDRDEVKKWLDELSPYPDTERVIRSSNPDTHIVAPLLVRLILRMELMANDWMRADLGEGKIGVRSTDHTWHIFDRPPWDAAESVVALDGTPCIPKWELILGEGLRHLEILTDRQKAHFVRDVLGIEVTQTSPHLLPYRSGENVSPERDLALFESIDSREPLSPALISSKQALKRYKETGLDEVIPENEQHLGHYGGMKGSNDFGTDRLGIVAGCNQPSYDSATMWGSLLGEPVRHIRGKGYDADLGPLGNEILEAERNHPVLQALMRFGREEEDGEKGAKVYVHTGAVPEWVSRKKANPEIRSWHSHKGGMKKVIDGIRRVDGWEHGEWKTKAITEDVDDLSSRQVRRRLKDLRKLGYIESYRGGRGNAYHWRNVSLDECGEYGHVEWR